MFFLISTISFSGSRSDDYSKLVGEAYLS